MSKVPTVRLNDGKFIPVFGLGTWNVSWNYLSGLENS